MQICTYASMQVSAYDSNNRTRKDFQMIYDIGTYASINACERLNDWVDTTWNIDRRIDALWRWRASWHFGLLQTLPDYPFADFEN